MGAVHLPDYGVKEGEVIELSEEQVYAYKALAYCTLTKLTSSISDHKQRIVVQNVYW